MDDAIEIETAYTEGYRVGKQAATMQILDMLRVGPVNLDGEDCYVFTESDLTYIKKTVLGEA